MKLWRSDKEENDFEIDPDIKTLTKESVNDSVEESDYRRAPSDKTTRKSVQRENVLIAIDTD